MGYVQLLVDRINGMFCGPCNIDEKRRKTCLQPRCKRKACTWSLISDSRGCGVNADGTTVSLIHSEKQLDTLLKCQNACEKESECTAVDYINSTMRGMPKPDKGLCYMYRKACSKPYGLHAFSYR